MTRNWRYARPAPPNGAPDPAQALAPSRAALGPVPGASLRALADLGLSDEEIARYHGLPPALVARLRHRLHAPLPQGQPVRLAPLARARRLWRILLRRWRGR